MTGVTAEGKRPRHTGHGGEPETESPSRRGTESSNPLPSSSESATGPANRSKSASRSLSSGSSERSIAPQTSHGSIPRPGTPVPAPVVSHDILKKLTQKPTAADRVRRRSWLVVKIVRLWPSKQQSNSVFRLAFGVRHRQSGIGMRGHKAGSFSLLPFCVLSYLGACKVPLPPTLL